MRAWGLLLAVALLLGMLGTGPAAAQEIGGGWLPGPGAMGENTYTGAIDAPPVDVRLTSAGTIELAGWFVDRTAEGWAGADDVEVFLGTLGNGGTHLANAYFARSRPDVARAFGRPDRADSGWSALVHTNALVPGENVLSVYAHTPAKGWWYRQVGVQVEPSATTRPVPPAQGYDVSFPQCGGPLPQAPAFAIVGVNGGLLFSPNPCLARQYVWALSATSPAEPRVSFYMNTGNPGPEASRRWPRAGTMFPRPCDGTWSADCSYDYGWQGAEDAFARARSVAGDAAALSPWWLDVEVANSWSEDFVANAASLQGSIGYLRSVNVAVVGIYALAADWEEIVGATSAGDPRNGPFAQLPNWRPGAQQRTEALSWCRRSVTGGRIEYVQYPSSSFDGNLPCR